MDYKQIAMSLMLYYNHRSAGHTLMLLEGAQKHPEGIIVVRNLDHARFLRNETNNQMVTLDGLSVSLMGRDAPLAIDNYPLYELLSGLVHRIDQMEKKLQQRGYDFWNTHGPQ